MLRQPGGSPLIFSTIFEKLERARPTPGSTFVWGSKGGSDEGAAVDLSREGPELDDDILM